MTTPADPMPPRGGARFRVPAWERAAYSGPAPTALRAAGALAARAGIVVRGSTIGGTDCVTWIGTPAQFAASGLFDVRRLPSRSGRVRASWGLDGWARTLPNLLVITIGAFHEPRSTRAVAPLVAGARGDDRFQAHLRRLLTGPLQ